MKVAVIGPESTGKTVLAQRLAAHYGAPWVAEYARGYVETLGRPYMEADVEAIARQQVKEETDWEDNGGGYVFFDTDLIITKVWMEYCYGRVAQFVEERLERRFFDLYLLCAPDLPWEDDPVREHGDDRDYFFGRYLREVQRLGTPYAVVAGQGEERVRSALQAIETIHGK